MDLSPGFWSLGICNDPSIIQQLIHFNSFCLILFLSKFSPGTELILAHQVNSNLLRRNPELMDAMADFRMKYAAKHTRFPVDHVIRCFGWTMDTSFLDSSTKPETWLSQAALQESGGSLMEHQSRYHRYHRKLS